MSDKTTTGSGVELSAWLADTLSEMSARAYCMYIEQMRRPTCLGWEAKVKAGEFGHDNLDSFMRAAELLGRHKALAEAAQMVRDMSANETSDALDRKVAATFPGGDHPFSAHDDQDDQDLDGLARWAEQGALIPLVDSSAGGVVGYVHRDHGDRLAALLNVAAMQCLPTPAPQKSEDSPLHIEALRIASNKYGNDDLQFDSNADISVGEDGVWVQGWAFVPNSRLGDLIDSGDEDSEDGKEGDHPAP